MSELRSEEKQFLTALNEFGVRFIIVGMSSAVMQDTHVTTQDIDLWIENLGSKVFIDAVNSVDGFYIPPGLVGLNPPMLGPDKLKIFDLVTHMHGLKSFEEEFNNAIRANVSGVDLCLLPLDRVIVSKESANREKDRATLPVLKAALAMKNSK